MTLTLPASQFDTAPKIAAFFDRARTRLAAVPGVRAVGGTGLLPGGNEIGSGSEVTRDGHVPREGERRFAAMRLRASPGYFRVMGTRLIAGRVFADADRTGTPPVVVLSESTARGLFPDATAAIGQRVRISRDSSAPPHEVVGVVADVRYRSLEAGMRTFPQLYQPLHQAPPRGVMSLVVEVDGDPSAAIASLRSAMRDVDPTIPPHRMEPVDAAIDRFLASRRLAGILISSFAGVTLLVSAIGLYGLMAQLVTERAREIGIRVALGAAPHAVRRGVVASGVTHAIAGGVAGAIGASAALRIFTALMPSLQQPGAWIFAVNAAVLLLTALAATWIPASRVLRVDPVVALRQQ
jgi:predicted lysophospholipase L1 biosynthesis ABC-type transport system permease subunit